MAPPSSTTVITSPPGSPRTRRSRTPGGSISLISPTEGKPADGLGLPLRDDDDAHDFRPPGPGASRGPCPALNTLAAHGYLPRDGHNISAAHLLHALQHPATYNISAPLARVLVHGGALLMRDAGALSLHELARHGRIEHDASVVHTNTAAGHVFAPTRCDTRLLDALLADDAYVTLDRISQRRVALERRAALDAVHQEIARGEWALVLGIFGRAHGGKVPSEQLRVWLKENRFPDGWMPTHQQGLFDTIKLSSAIRAKMNGYHTAEHLEGGMGVAPREAGPICGELLLQSPVKEARETSPAADPRPPKRQKSEVYPWS